MKLMTPPDYSSKMAKGLDKGVGEAVLYLAPSTEAGSTNMCPGHSPECFRLCLIHSGQMIMPHAHAARVRKTRLLLERPEELGKLLQWDIDAHLRWCRRRDLLPAYRFNGTSDFGWETWPVPHLGQTVHEYLQAVAPDAIVSEYTKRFGAMLRWLEGRYPSNLHMTFSLHELNEMQARRVLDRGGNVAVVFNGKKGTPLPSTWWGRPVLDGDEDDLRWLDRARAEARGLGVGAGLVIGLRFKTGRKVDRTSPFIVDPTTRIDLPLLRAA
jgi:hypothetical protein